MTGFLIESEASFLVVVDIQEKLAPAIDGIDRVVASTTALINSAQELNVPVVFTEHCPDRIGHTLSVLTDAAPQRRVFKKKHFGTLAERDARDAFVDYLPKRPIVCGTETHVCVLQTVIGLIEAEFDPVVVADAVGSRKSLDKEIALARMKDGGASIVTSEMVVFEWLKRADSQQFKKLLPIIKTL